MGDTTVINQVKDLLSERVNKKLLLQEMRKLAAAQGLEIREDQVCVGSSDDCVGVREWTMSVLAAFQTPLDIVVRDKTVENRIRRFHALGARQQQENSCWVAAGYLTDSYLRTLRVPLASLEQYRVREEKQLLDDCPTFQCGELKKQVIAPLASPTLDENHLPAWLPEAILKGPLSKRTQAVQELQALARTLSGICSGMNDADFLDLERKRDAIRETQGVLGLESALKLLQPVLDGSSDRTTQERKLTLYLLYLENRGLSPSLFRFWVSFLHLRYMPDPPFGTAQAPFGYSSWDFTPQMLSRYLRKGPLLLYMNALAFKKEVQEFLSIQEAYDNKRLSLKSAVNHVVIVYDIYYDYGRKEFMVRLVNTDPCGSLWYDTGAYKLLGVKAPNPSASFSGVEFISMPHALFLASLELCASVIGSEQDFTGFYIGVGSDNTDSY